MKKRDGYELERLDCGCWHEWPEGQTNMRTDARMIAEYGPLECACPDRGGADD